MLVLDDIIDRVYEAALDPGGWSGALTSLQAYYRASSVGLYSADLERGAVRLIHLQDIDPDYVASYVERFLLDNPWTVPELQAPGAIRNDRSLDDYYGAPGYYHATPLYNEWMAPQDFIHTLGVNLTATRREQTKFYIYRPRKAGGFSAADIEGFKRVTRHLQAAVKVAHRLEHSHFKSENALHLLDRLSFGVVFVDKAGQVLEANRFARALFEQRDGVAISAGTVVAVHRDDAPALIGAVRAALQLHEGRDGEPTVAFARRAAGRQPLSITTLPLPRGEHAFYVRGAAVALLIADPEREAVPQSEKLERRYGLTQSEARLVACLLRGSSLREAAEQTHLTYETARWYLKSVFSKTGTSRQAELVRLLLADPELVAGD